MSRSATARTAVALAAALLAVPALTSCASAADSVATVTVKGGTGTCDVSPTSVPQGTITISGSYTGEGTGEVYLYGKDGDAFTKVLGEVEDLTSTAKSFTAEVQPGEYEIKCEGGGPETRVKLTVTG
jgi:iron uptake system component EfeO